jgi:hypothetical protein
METASGPEENKRVRRRTFVVDRKFQLKYTFVIVLVGVIVSAVLGYFVYDLSRENTELAVMESEMAAGATDTKLMAEVGQFDTRVICYLIGFVSIMALALFIWGIFITHRVAGPIYIISRYLNQISSGVIPETRPLRKGDELKGFFDTFGDMLGTLKANNIREAEALEKAIAAIKAANNEALAETSKELQEIVERKRVWENYQS